MQGYHVSLRLVYVLYSTGPVQIPGMDLANL